MTLLRTQALVVLEQSLSCEVGHIWRVESVRETVALTLRAKQVLYRFKSELSPTFDSLSIHLSPTDPDHELWIIKI